MEYLSAEGLRLDGRRANECRKIACRLGVLHNVDGSAYLEQGNTKVLASVFGPQEVTLRSQVVHDAAIVRCQYKTANFATTERKEYSAGDRRHKEAALLIQQTFSDIILVDQFPRSEVLIHVQVLQADGGERAAAINAVTLALIDAGVPLRSFLCACTAGYVEDTPIVDVNYVERSGSGGAEIVVAVHSESGDVAYLQMDSKLPLPQFQQVMSLAVRGCRTIHKVLRQFVKQQVTGSLMPSSSTGSSSSSSAAALSSWSSSSSSKS